MCNILSVSEKICSLQALQCQPPQYVGNTNHVYQAEVKVGKYYSITLLIYPAIFHRCLLEMVH